MLHVIPHAVFLHVEDNVHDARVFREAVESITSNIRVRRVSTAETALDLIAGSPAGANGPPFDCVVTALRLPGLGGAALARQLRQQYDTATLPVVALTRDAPGHADNAWFDAIYQKADDARGLKPAVQAMMRVWFEHARRFHC